MKANQSGDRIRIARAMQKPKMTQDDLIACMQIQGFNLSKNKLSRIETGERYVTDLELLGFSRVLKVPVLWLLEEINNPEG